MTKTMASPQIEVTYVDHMGTDLTVVNAARVSFNKKSEWEPADGPLYGFENGAILKQKDSRLLDYLAAHKHDTPFNHCALSVHVKAPIFVARQLVKHEYLVINEVSRRYVDEAPEFYIPNLLRARAADKKQGSSEEHVEPDSNWGFSTWEEDFAQHHEDCLMYYRHLLAEGVCPEQARMVLPLSTMTEWYWTGLLSAWAKMVNLRIKPDAQYETRLVAEQVDTIARQQFPHAWEALRKYGVN